ncbi:putative trimethyllysine dioxygenase TmlH [Aspergillus homomorphus CBS 101889]|uniref:Trimethyllysine dioxygenase TmlH n=1 Tax=Aspergillus homomorphus (strain CBS 101889) TaxID=1450537 RepID=A0A395HUN2_ASPHC|nr:trimethyllysine dioxygenase TmlH [Aspergillus homomorphus CBS 101889]RAL09924.1 trimethyllysine dioxygenase TmlH [Aspergillus homomorphus CBS 101889]
MSAPGADHEFAPQEVSWQKRDILLFANSIGCKADELHFLYELHPRFATFPTYPIILSFKLTDQEVTDFYARAGGAPIPGAPKLDYRRAVDGQRRLVVVRPLPTSSTGRKFELRNKVIGLYDKGKAGTVLETEQSIVDQKTGDIYTKIFSSSFFVGQGGWGGPKGPSTVNYPPPEGQMPDATHVVHTTPETALLYRLNGDYNPLHATPEPGSKMGFGGTIIHGLFSWNSAAHGILRELGQSEPENMKEFQARFASPVKPGDKLTTEMWRMGRLQSGEEEIRFIVTNDQGKVVLSHGRCLLKFNGSTAKLGPFWLRENCQCRHCVNPKTKQRQVDTFAIPKDVQSESVTYATYGLKVEWSDGHLGLYPYPWLRAYGSKRPVTVPIAAVHTVKPRPYEAYALKAEFRPYPTVSFEDVMSSDNGVLRWLDRIHIFGFCFVKDMPANPASTEELLKRISFIRPTHYGAFWDFTADMTFKDSAYTNEALGAHTDNTYFTDPARLQLFHLLSHQGGAGGATLLVDGFKAAEAMRKENKPNYMAFMRTTQPYHSSGNEDVCIQPIHEFPVFEVHPQLDQLYRIRWNNYDRAPKANWDSKELTKWYTAARHWNEILTRSKHQIWIQLEPGMALTIDNWRMLHGRSAFTGKRRMCGGYINNDDFLSRYRLLKYGRQALLNNIGNYNDRSARDNPNVVI